MFSKERSLIIIIIFIFQGISFSQTVGTLHNTDNSSHNFTLIAPNSSKTTYLIDVCGGVVNQWESDYAPGLASYLDPDGNLYRAGRESSPTFHGGGIGGVIEKYNWIGDLIWRLDLSNDTLHQHHDFAVLPNGNILAICWEYISSEEAIQKGRNPDFLRGEIWPTIILEMEYVSDDKFNKVWEWRAWDHTIQNFDSSLPNYGIPSVNRRKIDINLINPLLPKLEDWLHMNSLDYNAELDQILLSSRNLSEIFIIDHGTTITESQGSSGGNRGHGGDLLYRFGNKNNFLSGDDQEKILANQHDANWIADNRPGMGNIILFNNNPVPIEGFSEVLEFDFDDDGGVYDIMSSTSYESFKVWEYNNDGTKDLYSTGMSGCQRLMNGNTLITSGVNGILIESDPDQEIEWKYVVPINGLGSISQYDPPNGNSIFKARSYTEDFFNFQLNLDDLSKIETNPTDNCIDFTLTNNTSYAEREKAPTFRRFSGGFEIVDYDNESYILMVANHLGQIIYEVPNIQNQDRFYDHDLLSGLYIISLFKKNQLVRSAKYLK